MAEFDNFNDNDTDGDNVNIVDKNNPDRSAEVTTGRKLKVENTPASGVDIIPSLGSNLYYDDMNSSSGGIARDTIITNTWTKVYDSTLAPTAGTSGLMLGFLLTLENFGVADPTKAWAIRLVIDSLEVFGSNGLLSTDITSISRYAFITDATKTTPKWGGLFVANDTFRWEAPVNLPVTYTSGVQIYIKKLSENRSFRAGLSVLTKV